jgi:hypothetical protein
LLGIQKHQATLLLDIGSIQASTDVKKTIPLSPIFGGLSLVGGIALVIIGRKKS